MTNEQIIERLMTEQLTTPFALAAGVPPRIQVGLNPADTETVGTVLDKVWPHLSKSDTVKILECVSRALRKRALKLA